MSNLRISLSRLTSKKVPAIALVLVGVVGMIAGVIAANIVTTSTIYTDVDGRYVNNTGDFTVTDNGLLVAANTITNNASTTVTFTTSTQTLYVNTVTAGQWADSISFTPPSSAGTHTVTITIKHNFGGGLGGTNLAGVTTGTWTTAVGNTGVVTVYVGLGTLTITAPMTVYVTVT